ncbi:MAG TPA: hypothetical protein VL992_07950 [Tepidisphaeraceae bacterium]|nr:hypothetical protein [Tepidisphaeraceae bacterium]
MYCRKCFARLDENAELGKCPTCGKRFDPDRPGTYLSRPFPDAGKAIRYLIITSIISLVFAFIVATFQMAGASGH